MNDQDMQENLSGAFDEEEYVEFSRQYDNETLLKREEEENGTI